MKDPRLHLQVLAGFEAVRRLAVIFLCGTLVLVGCRPKKASPVPPTTTTLLPATTGPTAAPTTTLDVSAPPTPAQLQDPAYWNAILAALNRVAGDAFRSVVSTKVVSPSTAEALEQIYGPSVFPGQYKALVDITRGPPNGLVLPPGDPLATVDRIVDAESRCVSLTASLDYGGVNTSVPKAMNAFRLMPRTKTSGASVNPTPWMIDDFFVIDASGETSELCTG